MSRSSSDLSSEFSSSIDGTSGTSSPESQEILSLINNLLAKVGIFEKKISTIKEVKRQASSMFVAIYEALFHISLDGIIRQPNRQSDFNENAQIVIDALSRRINKNLSHINGEDIAIGDLEQISYLVNIFTLYISKSFSSYFDKQDHPNSNSNIRGKTSPKDRSRSNSHSLSSEGGIAGLVSGHPNINQVVDYPYDLLQGISSRKNDTRRSGSNISPYTSGGVRVASIKQANVTGNSQSSSNRMSAVASSRELSIIIKGHESLIRQNEKLENAKRRREEVLLDRGKFGRTYNTRHQLKVNTIFRNRNRQDVKRQHKSSKMKQESEEYAMLRRIYGGFLGKLRQWYWDEDLEIREREDRSKKELMDQMASLKTVFKDRMDIMRESRESKLSLEKDSISDRRRYETAFKKLIKSEYEKIIQRYKNQKDQFVEYQENRRLEGYRHLLDMLQVEKWHDKLRH